MKDKKIKEKENQKTDLDRDLKEDKTMGDWKFKI